MNVLNFRAEVMAAFQAKFGSDPRLRLEFENSTEVDTDNSTVPVLRMDIRFDYGEQRDISDKPWVTEYGNLLFAFATPERTGTVLMNEVMMALQDTFERKYFAWGRVHVGSRSKPVEFKKGWVAYRFSVPFELDRLSQ